MPIKRFWFYNKNVDRILADRDMRMLNLMAYSHSGEGIQKVSAELLRERGEIFIYQPVIQQLDLDEDAVDPEFDRAGLEALRARIRQPVKTEAPADEVAE
jgi:hypothetical protein